MSSTFNLSHIDEGLIRRKLHETSSIAYLPAHSNGLVRASVLIPLYKEKAAWHVLLTRRTENVINHRGQVSFPGGAADPQDDNEIETALRETYEEIGMRGECIEILGQMPKYPTVSNFLITPVVGKVCWPVELLPAKVEVERIFSVPLAWLAQREHWDERLYKRSDGSHEMVVFYQLYEGETIWGITARIIVNFLEILMS